MKSPTRAAIQYPPTSTRPIRRKCADDSANASSVRTWAIAARWMNGTPRSCGASEALYSRWRMFRRNVRTTIGSQGIPAAR